MNNNYIQVVLDLPIDKVFDYVVPEHLKKDIEIGKRVWVEFRNKKTVAYVVGLLEESKLKKIKEIKNVIDSYPVIDSSLLSLSKWISKYYFCSWGEALAITLPPALRKGQQKTRLTALPPTKCPWVQPETFLVYENAQERIKIYLRMIEDVLKQNKGVIVLVPEISLTTKIIAKFVSHFGKTVAQYHSSLSSAQQFQEWQRIKKGESKIVIGTRSAVFSPLKNLGLIIVDEEQDNSYKEESIPRYNAREVAIKRAEIEKITTVLGSDTPSLKSYHYAKLRKYRFLKTEQKEKGFLRVKLIDKGREDFSVSPFLKTKIDEYLQKKERVIIYERLGKQKKVRGENFSKLGLIGIISADSILNLPNFLASEHTLQLLSQIVKQAQEARAELIIQTYNSTHFSITAAVKQDYEVFYKQEIIYRRELNYPPFVHFINIILKDKNEEKLKKRVKKISEDLKREFGRQEILGPVILKRFKTNPLFSYYYITLRTKTVLETNRLLRKVLSNFRKKIIVDVDPLFFF